MTKAMVDDGYGKFRSLWNLHEVQLDKEPYIPENLLDYACDAMTDGQEKLLAFFWEILRCRQQNIQTDGEECIRVGMWEST